MTAIVFELERAGKSPVVIFENPTAHGMPVVTNVAGNRKLLSACLGVEPANLPTAFRERCQTYIPCEVVKDASWHEVTIEGEALDLTKLPIPLQFTVDGGPYITAGQISARDPVTGVDTNRFSSTDAQGRNRLGLSLHSRRRMYEFQRRAEEQGKSLPAAITIGTHPLHYMGSMVYAYPSQRAKLELSEGLDDLELSRMRRVGIDHRAHVVQRMRSDRDRRRERLSLLLGAALEFIHAPARVEREPQTIPALSISR